MADDYTGGGFFADGIGDPIDELSPDELMLIAHLVITGKSQELAEKAWIN